MENRQNLGISGIFPPLEGEGSGGVEENLYFADFSPSPSPSPRGRGMRRLRVLFISTLILLVTIVFSFPLETRADFIPNPTDITKLLTDECLVPYSCFGGVIFKKKFYLCLIKVDYPPYVILNPVAPFFNYYEIVQPWPPMLHGLYHVLTVVPELGGTTKLRDRREKKVYVAGKYVPGAHVAYRQSCTANKGSLPLLTSAKTPISGTIRIWGTGCKPGEIVLNDLGKCKKVK